MRVLGFTERWPKLEKWEFTTFRFPRQDKDWYEGEIVQVVYRPRGKNRKALGVARIVSVHRRLMWRITRGEAIQDGFSCQAEMRRWLEVASKDRPHGETMSKLTLQWVGVAMDKLEKEAQ